MNKYIPKIILLLFCLITGFFVITFSNSADSIYIIISEVRADYGNIMFDSNGVNHGFVEIHNLSQDDICLDGWYISDSITQRDKYQITDCTIKGGGFAVFWTGTAEDVSYIDDYYGYDYQYFLGFSIDETEDIVICNNVGNTIDKVNIPSLDKQISYSRYRNTGNWIETVATPGDTNSEEKIEQQKYITVPTLSLMSGFYTEPINLEITADENCKIYYTTDGTQPTVQSTIYTQPLTLTDNSSEKNIYSSYNNISTVDKYVPEYTVPKGNVIRAIAIDSDGNISDETKATYFIDYNGRYGFENVPVISIIVNSDDLFNDDIGIYVLGNIFKEYGSKRDFTDYNNNYRAEANYKMEGKGWKRPAYIEYFDSNHKLYSTQEISLSIHGGWSVAASQKGFNLYALPEADGKENILDGVFKGKQSAVMLRPGGHRDTYSTKFRDVLNQSLVSDRNIAIQNGFACNVFINGEYWGMYNLQERLDESFIAAKYNVSENNIILLKNTEVVAGDADAYNLYSQIVEFAATNDLSIAENYKYITDRIDVQSYIDYYCFQIYIANTDIIQNNYAVWRTDKTTNNKYSDGKWRWALYDTDDSAGLMSDGKLAGRTNADTDSFNCGQWHGSPLEDTLFVALMNNESFKLQFAQTFIKMGHNNFDYKKVEKAVDSFYDQYCKAAVITNHRFITVDYTEEDYAREVQVVKDFYSQRYGYIYQYMVDSLGLATYGY